MMLVEKIDKVMNQYIENNEMAGAELFVHKDGKKVYHGMWGYSNLEAKTTIAEDTIYCMCSMTKILTTAGFLKLVEQGRISFDDEVKKYIPSFENKMVIKDERFEGMENFVRYFLKGEEAPLKDAKTVPAHREITIRDLLTHSSGLEMGLYGMLSRMKMKSDDETLGTRIDKFAKMPLDFQPGIAAGYSPAASFDTLARLVEIITGENFADYMKREVFKPLKMKDMTFHLNEEQAKRRMPLYKRIDGKLVNVTGSDLDLDGMITGGPLYISAAGGAYGRMSDYNRFTLMLANEGTLDGIQILKPETIRMMYQEHAYQYLEAEPGMEWGLGVKVRQDPVRAESFAIKGTYGWSGAFGTHMFICPEIKLAVTFGTSREDLGGAGSYISKKVEELVFAIWG